MKTKALLQAKEKTDRGEKAVATEDTATKIKTVRNAAKPAITVKADSTQAKKTKKAKDVQCNFLLPEPEHTSVQELRHKLSEALGHKVKKGQLFRVAARILLNQTPTKLKAELAKIEEE